MTDPAFHTNQALYDAAEPDDDELAPAEPVSLVLHHILDSIEFDDAAERTGVIYRLSDRQATAAIWIDGHEYSLTLNREDG